ncbi:MAG: sensor histidine kinase [Chlorobi bacterium]|nr:sensor histidine kinase [Chlorobiota bacterium]
MSEYDSSLYYSFRCLEYVRARSLYKLQYAMLLLFIGDQYRATAQYDNSIRYLTEAWALANKTNNTKLKSNILNRLAAVYFETGKYDEALLWADSSLRLAEFINNKVLSSNNLAIKGAIFRDQGDYKNAIESFQEALRFIREFDNPSGEANILNNISITYFLLKDYHNTVQYAMESYDISSKLNLKALSVVSSEYLARAYAEIGEFELAYKYHVIFEHKRMGIFSEKSDKLISELNTKYETQKKEQQIEKQQMQIEKKDYKIKKKNITLTMFLFIFVFLAVFSIYIYSTRKKLKKVNRLLTKKNLQISKQKIEIETYAKKVNNAYEKLRELDEYKQAMTSMLVHDLKNPLNLLANLDVFDNEKEKSVIVNRASKQMLILIMNLLDINKAENNSLTLNKTKVDLFEIIRLSLQETEYLCLEKNIEILNKSTFNYGFMADKDILTRVFINFLTNAIKYSHSNDTISINTAITKDNLLRISVKDEGIGIAKEHHEVIFEKFAQVKKIKSGQIGSTGLGLAFCKVAAESHDWVIGVDSEPGNGAEFWIMLNEYQINSGSFTTFEENAVETENNIEEQEISENVKLALEPFLLGLKKLDVYRISEIKKLIRDIRKKDIKEMTQWLNEVRKAAETFNEKKYIKLMEEGSKRWGIDSR